MAEDAFALYRAAGAVLRAVRRPGVPLARLVPGAKGEPLKPALAIEAVAAAMRARFDLPQSVVTDLLVPAFADWRDAVGCADPLLVPANAQGPAAEKHLVPLPLPSWCAHLIDAGVIRLDGPAAVDGARVVQHAWLLAIREAELSAVECFPVTFAGKFAAGPAALHVHLAHSPAHLAEAWRGPLSVRAAAHPIAATQPPVRLWLGPPSTPGGGEAGNEGTTVTTWTSAPMAAPGAHDPAVWPQRWRRWAVLRVLEGREPQGLWDLSALWRARLGSGPEATPGGAPTGEPATVRVAIDLGSTATVLVEEDSAAAGSVGSKLVATRGSGPQAIPSGFRRLAGDAASAHLYGCGERLQARGAELPTALMVANAATIGDLLGGPSTTPALLEQAWLPQAPPEGTPEPDPNSSVPPPAEPCLRLDRFKSPELLLLSEWLAEAPRASAADLTAVSRRALETYGYLLGRALAAAHSAPLVIPEGGRWALRWPRLGAAEVVLTYPQCAFSAAAQLPFSEVFDGVGALLASGLTSAWPLATHRMVTDPAAAKAARRGAANASTPIEVFADFGGLTLQIAVRVPNAPGRPAPFIAGTSMSYLLGGERLIDATAYASADLRAQAGLREAFRSGARRLRRLIASGGSLPAEGDKTAAAVRAALEGTVFALLRRQLEGTLRRAAPDLTGLRGAGVQLFLLGAGWKLLALDAPDADREAATLRRLKEFLAAQPLLPDVAVELQRMTKKNLCEGALRVRSDDADALQPLELQGVDVGSSEGLRQRWFGVADARGAAEPDLSPHPADAWWRLFAGDLGEDDALLRVEQWFSGGDGPSPFRSGLSGGKLAFDARRSMLKQWLDVSGPSLVALRIHQGLLRGD